MSPIDELQSIYSRYCPTRSLEVDMGLFIRHGYVIATPEFVVMGKAIKKGAKWELINDPTHVFAVAAADTWFVSAFAGRQKDFLAFLPYEMKWLAWQRRGAGLRYWTLQHFRTRCEIKTPCSTGGSSL